MKLYISLGVITFWLFVVYFMMICWNLGYYTNTTNPVKYVWPLFTEVKPPEPGTCIYYYTNSKSIYNKVMTKSNEDKMESYMIVGTKDNYYCFTKPTWENIEPACFEWETYEETKYHEDPTCKYFK